MCFNKKPKKKRIRLSRVDYAQKVAELYAKGEISWKQVEDMLAAKTYYDVLHRDQ